jgi:phage terminase Nu1 subunit (DNA packaging protein)
MKKKVVNVGTSKLARILGVSERYVLKLVELGLPKTARGEFPLAEALVWCVRHYRTLLERREGGDDAQARELSREIRRERLRHAKAAADLLEAERDQKHGNLVEISVVREFMTEHIRVVRDHFLVLPKRIAHQLEGESRDVIEGKLYQAIRGTLSALAQALRNEGRRESRLPEMQLAAKEE